ncbi:PD-(D/E)XK nuclease-like domain-containing protein [Microbacterium sp. VKM Ac-2923]|uniref:PD-(D/E)XK nuclease-like domain-containing protein n=1 Tax=Microbacterium sp. VKM Ac-2923 TaxID=2929476 RepID=UPI001FB4798A|nr:PD-(D/E)XK nuclease-like domain-containing protein [Microbacterium sp. VKM Ac-2923]MCJ1709281.1 PD-(D/E)XK nuclease-like domain-containing protein [Microbacterium sp. VKM Ac-2923]
MTASSESTALVPLEMDVVDAEIVEEGVVSAFSGQYGIFHDVPEGAYHAHPALSSTQLKWLLDSAARYRYNKDHPQPFKKALDVGSATHVLVLGVGWGVVELDYPDFRTKAAQAARDEAYAANEIPMLSKDMAIVRGMAEAVLSDPDAREVLEGSSREVSVVARDAAAGLDLRCRFDVFQDDLSLVGDLKTSANRATKAGFSKAVADFKYDVSHEHYLDTLQLVAGERPEKRYIVVEKEAPYFTAVFKLSDDEIQMGRKEARYARAVLMSSLESGIWPHRPLGVQTTEAPMRRIYEHIDRFKESA